VVANPPFSDKNWSTGLNPAADPFQRFVWGVPPAKNGDYAYLLHIIRSLKKTGKGACILPHGVLFRGNAEAVIRRKLVESGYLKGIIGLPPNLFYGTGIPACILVLDKENAEGRRGIFMIDASKGFKKDGDKNRLRERDIHRIVDTFKKQLEVPRYSRLVSLAEIAENEYNLNLPRYIDSSEPEDLQDIEGHLRGGIPERDITALEDYWKIMPSLQQMLLKPLRPGYYTLQLPITQVKNAILEHDEFKVFTAKIKDLFHQWKEANRPRMMSFGQNEHPKELIETIAEDLLTVFRDAPLVDAYELYQHLMDYWTETMQDDCYLLSASGWIAEPTRIIEKDKKGKPKDKGWICDLVPKQLVVARYFPAQQSAIASLEIELEATTAQLTELEEEHGGEDGFLGALDKINKTEVNARLQEIKNDPEAQDEIAILQEWLKLNEAENALKRKIKDAENALDKLAYEKYATLTEAEVKTLVVDDKWLPAIAEGVNKELDRVSQSLTGRIRQLAERYATPLPQLVEEVEELSLKVAEHLKKMGMSYDG